MKGLKSYCNRHAFRICMVFIVGGVFADVFLWCNLCPRILGGQVDYQGFILGVLACLFTAVVGWNIYQHITTKDEMESLKERQRELQSFNYAFMAQLGAVGLESYPPALTKEHMIHYAILSMGCASRLVKYHRCLKASSEEMCNVMRRTADIKLPSAVVESLLVECGSIEHREVGDVGEFINLLKACRDNE